MSDDGRYVAFQSSAGNLVPGPNRGGIFRHDLLTGQTIRVSVASDGTLPNGSSDRPSISNDGRFVAFESDANNLVPGDTNVAQDVFLHDCDTGQTILVSASSDGTSGNGYSSNPRMRGGQVVLFDSIASNLVPGDTNHQRDVFVYEIGSGITTRATVSSSGVQANGESVGKDVSEDGRYVLFASTADNLVPGDTNNYWDVYRADRSTGQIVRVSVADDGSQGNLISGAGAMSPDGRYVAFSSTSTNLVPGDTNLQQDVFLRNIELGRTTRVSVAGEGTQGNDRSFIGGISGDGRYVVFVSYASNLVPADDNGTADVFVHDCANGATMLLSAATDGHVGNARSGDFGAAISADGAYIAFTSLATNLLRGLDTNRYSDVFVAGRLHLWVEPNASAPLGAAITLNATDLGAGFEYRFFGRLVGREWSTIQYYSGQRTCAWTPREAGDYQLKAWARQVGSAFAYEVNDALNYTVTAGALAQVTLVPSPSSPAGLGAGITLQAAPPAGAGALEYRFYARLGSGAWQLLQGYSTQDTCPWTPAQAGTYRLLLWARAVGSAANWDAYDTFFYYVWPPLTAVSLGISPGTTVSPGAWVTLTAIPAGGAVREYWFFYNDGAGWVRLTNGYQPSNRVRWLPPASGRFPVKVWAREVGSTAPFEAYAYGSLWVL